MSELTIKQLWIESCLNKILVPNLDNHDKEYLKLFRIWRVEIEKLLEQQQKNNIEKISKIILDSRPYEIWTELLDRDFKYKATQDKQKEYIKWYNTALKDLNKTVKILEKKLINNLKNNLK